MGDLALSNSSFLVPYLLILLSSWRRLRSWIQHAVPPSPSWLYFLIFVWWNSKELVSMAFSCLRIPNRHFPTWKIKVLPPVTLPTAPHPSVSKSRARTTARPHGSTTPVASRLVVYSVHWRMHSIATSTWNNYVSFTPLADPIPRFSGVGTSWAQPHFERGYHFTCTLSFISFFLWMPISWSRFRIFHPSNSELFFLAAARAI